MEGIPSLVFGFLPITLVVLGLGGMLAGNSVRPSWHKKLAKLEVALTASVPLYAIFLFLVGPRY